MSIVESPFIKYCDDQDKELFDSGIAEYYRRAFETFEKDPTFLTRALIDDFVYRSKYFLNVLMSIEGQQGSTKSIFGLNWGFRLGNIYGMPFNMQKELYAIPEDLDHGIRESERRTTHILDEQRKKNVGLGARSTELNLIDYEEQGRGTQKNIIYISPEVKNRSHYFLFSSYDLERVENKNDCLPCPVSMQNVCFPQKFKTECGKVPFWERTGYIKSMTFLLKTKRKIDGWEVPRGFVKLPMVTPETFKEYDVIKEKNLKKLESQEEDSFKYIELMVDDFVKQQKKILIKKVGGKVQKIYKLKDRTGNTILKPIEIDTSKYVVVSQKVIEATLYSHIRSRRKYTSREVEIIVALARGKLQDECVKLNESMEREANSIKRNLDAEKDINT